MKPTIVGTSLFFFASCAAGAQTSSTPLSFDVVSVKPAAPQPDGLVMRRLGPSDPGMLRYENVTVKLMLMVAYNLKEYQVEGPDWIDSLGYDVVAKMPPGTTQDQTMQMLQTMLAERFGVKLHRETRQVPVYALVVAKGGSKMKEVEVPAVPADAPPPPPPGRGPVMVKGPGVRMNMSPNGMHMMGYMTMAQLTNQLTRAMARPVLDETELNKTYDVDITWMPDEMSQPRMGSMPHPPPGGGGGDGGPEMARGASEPAATLPQALQDKLGLRLDARKSSAEILVVDHAERVPVEN